MSADDDSGAKFDLPTISAEELHRRLRTRSASDNDDRPTCPFCEAVTTFPRKHAKREDGYDRRCDRCGSRFSTTGANAGEFERPASGKWGERLTRVIDETGMEEPDTDDD